MTPQEQAILDEVIADFRDTVIDMADKAAGEHDKHCPCNAAQCPGWPVLTFLLQSSQKDVIAFASIAIRMLGDERAKNGRE